MEATRNCQTRSAILDLPTHGVLFVKGFLLSRNGVSFSTIRALRNLDWWNVVRGLIGLKDRSKRSLYWLVCVSRLYKHLRNLCRGLAVRVWPWCSAVTEDHRQYVCGLLRIPSGVCKVLTVCPFPRLAFHKVTVWFYIII